MRDRSRSPSAVCLRRSCRRRLRPDVLLLVVAPAVVPAMLTLAVPSAAAEPTGLDIVAVVPAAQGGTSVVMQLRPAPSPPLPDDAVTVSAADMEVRAVTRPLLSERSPLALVLDASQRGAPALPQTLSGAAALVLRQRPDGTVVVVADRSPPQLLTRRATTQPAALSALSDVRPGGSLSTPDALALAEQRLPHPADAPSLIVLSTSGAAPAAPRAAQMVDRLRASRTVLSVVQTSKEAESWSSVATATGGLAVRSTPQAAGDAFDHVSAALRARYVVSFTPPASATSVDLRVLWAGRTLTAQVPVSGRVGPSGQGAASGSPLPWLVLAGLAVVAVALALLLFQGRRRVSADSRPPDGAGDVAAGSPLPPTGTVGVADVPRTPGRALPFRQEALTARAERAASGAPLQFARWPGWLYGAVLGLLIGGIAFGLTARTNRTVSGPVAVDVERGVFTAALPQDAASGATAGRSIDVSLPGRTGKSYEGRITSTTVTDLSRLRQSPLRDVPGADPGDVLVTGELVPRDPATSARGALSPNHELTGRATIVLGSDRLLAVVLGGFGELFGSG